MLLARYRKISLVFSLLTLTFLFTFVSYLSLDNNYIIKAQQKDQQMEYTRTGAPLNIIPGLTSNILTGVSFLIGTSSFILGLRIQSASKTIMALDRTTECSSFYNYYQILRIIDTSTGFACNSHQYLRNTCSWEPSIF
jgi:hypothetical protein